MSDPQWGDEQPLQKKSVPTWVWFCGGGCLLVAILAVAGGFLGMQFVTSMMDPEEQWPKLQEVLPFDERPPQLEMKFGMAMMGQAQFTLLDQRGFLVQIQAVPGAQGTNMRKRMFESETPELVGNLGMLDFENVEKGTLEIQGRELPIVRMQMAPGDVIQMLPGVEDEAEGEGQAQVHVIYVDLTEAGDDGMLWLQYTRDGPGGRITDEELLDFFEPFHVGSDR